ncbi:MAG TPA: VOC family protein [Candidatus Acidoferrales bacterium]|nr:VOC family protein [Candidatus Acidoferrales bacterium]
MAFRGLALISIPVSDQKRAKDFYTNVLGFALKREAPYRENTSWIELSPGDGQPSFTLVTWFPSMPAGSLRGLVLLVDNLEATCADLKVRGLSLPEIKSEPWGRFATFSDPDGNGWVLQEAREKS